MGSGTAVQFVFADCGSVVAIFVRHLAGSEIGPG